MKLRCRQCGTEHKATARHFPIMLEGPAGIQGYLCLKCAMERGRRIRGEARRKNKAVKKSGLLDKIRGLLGPGRERR